MLDINFVYSPIIENIRQDLNLLWLRVQTIHKIAANVAKHFRTAFIQKTFTDARTLYDSIELWHLFGRCVDVCVRCHLHRRLLLTIAITVAGQLREN